MRYSDDEFNFIKITNEDENPNFEFGSTQDDESTSYADNSDRLRDEINDNPTSNSDKRPEEEKRKEKKEESSNEKNKDSGSKGGGSSSSAGTTIATVAGAAFVSVATLSTLVGINLFFNAKCTMNNLDVTPISIKYELELTDTNKDSFIISLENEKFKDSKDLVEGRNEGLFENLQPSTKYSLSVIDVTYNNYVMYKEDVTTQNGIMKYTVSFETNGGTPVESQLISEGGFVVEPENPSKEGYSFSGWYSDAELNNKYDFATPVHNDFVLYAGWLNDIVTVSVSFDPNGGSGTMEGRTVDSGETILLPVCDFLPPDDTKVFNRWRMGSPTGTSYAEGAEVTITEDTIFYASWKDDDRFVLEFDANGGSGTMDPIKSTSASPTVPEPEFVAPEHYVFDHWVMNDVDYYPGEKVSLFEKTGNVMTAYWLPFVDFNFHIEYIELNTPQPVGGDITTLHFTYTFWDNNNNNMYHANEFELVLETIGGEKITLTGLDIPVGVMSSSIEFTFTNEDDINLINYYDAFNYYIYGIADKNGEEVKLNPVKGSFEKRDVKKQDFYDVFISSTRLTDDATVPYFLRGSGTAVIALRLSYSDPLNAYGGFSYEYQLHSGTGSGDSLTKTKGCQFVTIDYKSDSMLLDSFTIFDSNSAVLRTYSNITFAKTDEVGVFGYEIDESALANLNIINQLKIKMIGTGYDNGTKVSDLSGENFFLYLEPQVASGSLGKPIKLPFTPDPDSTLGDQISVTVAEEQQEIVSKYFRNYAMSIRFAYKDTQSGTMNYISSYVKHTFTYK